VAPTLSRRTIQKGGVSLEESKLKKKKEENHSAFGGD